MEERKAKILVYDIECTGILGYAYGMWDTNIHKVIEQPILLSFSYCWYEEGKKQKIINRGLIDYGTFKQNHKDDKALAKDLWNLFNEADITVGHNSKSFDDKMARMFFLKHNFTPPSPHKPVDTKLMAKQVGRFGSNSLNNLSNFFDFGQKSEVTHAALWWDCLQGDNKAWRKMKTYNQQDVSLTIKLYEKLKPWVTNHPNLARLEGRPDGCPRCHSQRLHQRGIRYTNVSAYFRYQCQDCKGWCTGRQAFRKDEDVKPTYVTYSN